MPWGNCNEPSNVKADGGSCPIRWQCPACSHYNPDPSHLPAIEDQVRSLKASLETARAIGAAPTPSPGLKAGSPTTGKVIEAMKAQMDAMPAAERREVEEASQVLRRLRAGAAGTRSPHPTSWAAGEEAEATVLAPGGAGAA